MIEFSDTARRWNRKAVRPAAARREKPQVLKKLEAWAAPGG